MLERKVVTVMFADLVGSTSLSEGTDPEQLREFFGQYRDVLRREIEAFGGTMEKFIGDAAMAIFGFPSAHDDDPGRAVQAALSLRRAVSGMEYQPVPHVRVGIATGPVIAEPGAAERGDFVVTGEVVHLAQRLEAAAEPDEILVDDRTWENTQTLVAYKAPQTIGLKGFDHPMTTYAALELTTAPTHQLQIAGRDHELSLLELLFTRVSTERRAHLVTIIGPAGIGKSRLALAAGGSSRARNEQAVVRTGTCKPYGEAQLYCPISGVLSDDLAPELDEIGQATPWLEALSENLRRVCEQGGRSDLDHERLAQVLAWCARSDCPIDPPPTREELFRTWRVPLELHASSQPTVVTFENIHWSSEEVLDFIESIPVALTGMPVLVLVTARPELLDRRPRWGGGAGETTILQLGPVSGDAGRQIARSLLEGEVDPNVLDYLEERGEGNPHFLIEFTRALVAAGRIQLQSGRWAFAGDPAEIRVPDSVQGAVAARIDGLAPDEKRALMLASYAAYSRFFFDRPMRLMGDLEPTRLEAALGGLVAKGLAREIPGPSGIPGSFGFAEGVRMFSFEHLQLREVAHEMVPKAERVRLHVAFVDWLDELMAMRPDTRRTLPQIAAANLYSAWQIAHERGRVSPGLASRALDRSLEASAITAEHQAHREVRDSLKRADEIARSDLPERLPEVASALANLELRLAGSSAA